MGKEIILPQPDNGFEYVLSPIKKTKLEYLQEEKVKYQDEFKKLKKPDDAEILELGKQYSTYYQMETFLLGLETELKIK